MISWFEGTLLILRKISHSRDVYISWTIELDFFFAGKSIVLNISSVIERIIWGTTWQNQQSDCASSEDSDQPGCPPSLIRVFAVGMKKHRVLSYPLSAQRRFWSDCADAQADLSLRWVHTHFVGFVTTTSFFTGWQLTALTMQILCKVITKYNVTTSFLFTGVTQEWQRRRELLRQNSVEEPRSLARNVDVGKEQTHPTDCKN